MFSLNAYLCSLSSGDLMSPKSDSELELRSLEPSPLRAESHMQWAWGRLPKVSSSVLSPIPAFRGLPGPSASG